MLKPYCKVLLNFIEFTKKKYQQLRPETPETLNEEKKTRMGGDVKKH